jgi:hypothetical protein
VIFAHAIARHGAAGFRWDLLDAGGKQEENRSESLRAWRLETEGFGTINALLQRLILLLLASCIQQEIIDYSLNAALYESRVIRSESINERRPVRSSKLGLLIPISSRIRRPDRSIQSAIHFMGLSIL